MASTIHPLDSSRLHLYLPAKDKPSFIKLSLLEFKIWMSKQSWEKRTKLEVSHSITWDYTTKLQSKQHKQHGTDTETDTQINKTEQSTPKKTIHLQSIGLQHRRQEYITEKTVSSTSSAGKTGQLHVKEHKFKSIKDLNVRLENIKLLKENLGRTLFDMNHSNIFLILSPKAKETKAKINKWDLIKLKSFCAAKETINKMKTIYWIGENICKLYNW